MRTRLYASIGSGTGHSIRYKRTSDRSGSGIYDFYCSMDVRVAYLLELYGVGTIRRRKLVKTAKDSHSGKMGEKYPKPPTANHLHIQVSFKMHFLQGVKFKSPAFDYG